MTDGSYPENVGTADELSESIINTSDTKIDLNASSLTSPIPKGEKQHQFLKSETEIYFRQLDKIMAKLSSEALAKGNVGIDGRRELQMNDMQVEYIASSVPPYVTAETFIDFRKRYINGKKVRATVDWGSPAMDTPYLAKLIEDGIIDPQAPSSEIVFHEQSPYFPATSTIFYVAGDHLLKFADEGKNEEMKYAQADLSLADLLMLRIAINEFSEKSECGQKDLSVTPEDFTKGYDFQSVTDS